MIQNKNTGRLLKISILLNVCLVLSLVYFKRDAIIIRVESIIGREAVSDAVLLSFNKEPYKSSNGEMNGNFAKTIEILFLGNSLTITGVPEEEKDRDQERGLVSTEVQKDYVHLLIKMISEQKKVNIRYSIINIADFERNFSRVPFDYSKLANASVQKPDFVIFQIGENVSREDIVNKAQLFKDRYSELIGKFENSTKIVCLPFWPDKNKINHITNVAINGKAYLVDLSHLGAGTDSQNFAYSSRNYKNPGVGMHPGDYGMGNIANNLFSVFNVVIPSK